MIKKHTFKTLNIRRDFYMHLKKFVGCKCQKYKINYGREIQFLRKKAIH